MPTTLVIALELFLGAYGWALAQGGLAQERQRCAAAFLLLGTLRTSHAVLHKRQHRSAEGRRRSTAAASGGGGGRGGGGKEDKVPLLPESKTAPEYSA